MSKAAKFLLGATMVLTATSAQTPTFSAEPPFYFVDGNYLNDLCRKHPDAAMGYIEGAFDMGSIRDVLDHSTGLCMVPEVQGDQLRDVTCKYLMEHPETRQFPAAFLVQQSVEAAWPCKAE